MKFRLFLVAALFVPNLWAQATHQVFATNEGSQDISVIDGASDEVVATLKDVGKPRGLTLCPNDKRLYVTNQKDSQLLVIDTLTQKAVSYTHLTLPTIYSV